MYRKLIPFALVLGLVVTAHAQRDFSEVEIEATKVAGNVWMLVGSGGNIGVTAGEDGFVMIDDQFAPLADKIRAALGDIASGDLKFIVNTHWHGDHTGGNPVFGPEATIISHDNVRERLVTDQTSFGEVRKALPEEGWPVITFQTTMSIHFNGEELKITHYPNAHTDGDGVIHFTGSKVLHAGDLLFNRMFPYVDLDHGGSVEGLIDAVADILENIPEGTMIIPGHGELADIADLEAFHTMLLETTAHVKDQMEAGKSLEDIKAAGLQDKYADWSWGFISTERWIETIHRNYSMQ